MPKIITQSKSLWWQNLAHLVTIDTRSYVDIAFESRIPVHHLKSIINGKYKNCMVGTVARIARTLGVSISCVYYSATPPTQIRAARSVAIELEYERGD